MRQSGKITSKILLLIVLAGVGAFAFFVPVRDCPTCIGTGGLKLGNISIHECRSCGGDGKQTLFEIAVAKFRKTADRVGN